MAANRQNYNQKNKNVISFHKRAKTLGPVSNTVILIVLACLLGLIYLTQVVKTNTYGAQLYASQQQQTQLESQYTNLQVSSAQLQSLDRVQNNQVSKNLSQVSPSATLNN
jgi:Flp pilus assembly protein CpaB